MVVERTHPLSGSRVLIVEDEYYLADDLSRSLVQVGAEVVGPAGSMREAERLIEEGNFDCAVIDMNLHGELAFALAGRLHAASVPYVVATGYSQVSLPDALSQAPRVEKPNSPRDIIGMLAALREKQRVAD